MTELLTSAQMRAIEAAAIASGAVTGLELMERAGRGVVDAVWRWRPELQKAPHRAVILCGPGNNGGDGYVIARLLRDLHWDVEVLALAPPKSPDAQEMFARWGGAALDLTHAALKRCADADLIVDALFGTGLSRPPSGEVLSVIATLGGTGPDWIDDRARLVAVDAPSGLCLDSGRMLGGGHVEGHASAVAAGLTVTFECPKVGHFLADGPNRCGALDVVDLGLSQERAAVICPKDAHGDLGADDAVVLLDRRAFARPSGPDVTFDPTLLGKRSGDRNKFDHGHVVVVSGGMGRTGAARLAARAALRIGAGVVTMASPGAAMMECATQLTSVMLRRADDAEALSQLLKDERINAVCLGPGLGLDGVHRDMIEAVLLSGKRAVLDADAITHLSKDESLRALLHTGCVLTPHFGEFRRLCPDLAEALQHPRDIGLNLLANCSGEKPDSDTQAKIDAYCDQQLNGPAFSKVDAAREASARLGCGVVLKGPDTTFATKFRPAFVHSCAFGREVPWLATAGAGDVLAGLIAGQIAKRPHDLSGAVSSAIWLHAEAARAFGPGLIAEDLPEIIPQVLRGIGL